MAARGARRAAPRSKAKKRKPSAGGIRLYAAHRKDKGLPGGTATAVEKALATGRIERGKDGKIHFAAADRQWKRRTDPKRTGPSAAAAVNGKHADGSALLTVSRAREAAVNAELAEIRLARERERTIDRELVTRKLVELAELVKGRSRSLPGRLVDVLSPAGKRRLEEEIDVMLEDFAREAGKL